KSRVTKLEKRVALDNDVDSLAAVARFAGRRGGQQGVAEKRHPFRQVTLLGAQPKRALRPRLQKARAVRADLGQRNAGRFPVERDSMLGRRAVAVFAVPGA